MISDTVTKLLKKSGKRKADVARDFNLSRSNIGDRFRRDTFKARDLVKIAKLCNAELCFITEDGEKISFDYSDAEKVEQ